MQENDFILDLPRYVDTFEPELDVDIATTRRHIAEIEAGLAETRKKMDNHLNRLRL